MLILLLVISARFSSAEFLSSGKSIFSGFQVASSAKYLACTVRATVLLSTWTAERWLCSSLKMSPKHDEPFFTILSITLSCQVITIYTSTLQNVWSQNHNNHIGQQYQQIKYCIEENLVLNNRIVRLISLLRTNQGPL